MRSWLVAISVVLVAIAHTGLQNGDVMFDPEMVFRFIDWNGTQLAEPSPPETTISAPMRSSSGTMRKAKPPMSIPASRLSSKALPGCGFGIWTTRDFSLPRSLASSVPKFFAYSP